MRLHEDIGGNLPDSAEKGNGRQYHAFDLFEKKHRLLESLTRRQLELIVPSEPKRILDVGCGTGISSMILYNSLSAERPPRVFAIDINDFMLQKAKERYRNMPGLYFVRGSADNLYSFFHEGFDGIFFTPSLFQIPNFRESIRQVAGLVVPGGVVSICHFKGLFAENGEDAFRKVFQELKCGAGSSWRQEFETIFSRDAGFRSTMVDFHLEAGSGFLEDFLSISAQPLRQACEKQEEKEGRIFTGWKFFTARRERKLDS